MTILDLLILLVVIAVCLIIYRFFIRPLLASQFPQSIAMIELILLALLGIILIIWVLGMAGIWGPNLLNRRIGGGVSMITRMLTGLA